MRFVLITLSALAILAGPAMAHPDHEDGEVEDVSPEQAARNSIVRLITQAKLPASWTKATLVQTKLRTVKGLRQTVLTFRNAAETNKARQTLYVVLDSKGDFISADHTI